MSVSDGKQKLTYDYHADGQIASANYGNGKTEDFLWDGLALVHRGGEHFINEPHVGGGNPVVSSKGVAYFNDMLGTTLGKKEKSGKYSAAALSAFGERLDNVDGTSLAIRSLGEGWFTGKPFVEGLGRTFFMRNYRAGLAKWQTADPMGYPDGWNQLAYCGNAATSAVDLWGCEVFDYAWELIFGHWMVGGGVELDLFYDEYFTSYMASNMLLRDQIEQWLMNFARGHESGRINLTRHAEIENGYLTGYELLHGTNATVGDFQIVGNYTSAIDGKWKYYFFNVELTWNDIIDPNYSLFGDNVLAFIFKRYPGANPADYVIRIRWKQLFVLREAYE
jgi:RHS repeat-associated protein